MGEKLEVLWLLEEDSPDEQKSLAENSTSGVASEEDKGSSSNPKNHEVW